MAAVVVALLVAAPSHAAFPGGNGKITYATQVYDPDSGEFHDWEVITANADGTGSVAITSNTDLDVEPTWSPDGQKIAFASTRGGNHDIYVMNPDGTGQLRLTEHAANDQAPEWSPDGEKIAFASNRDGSSQTEIYVMNADGSAETRLTTALGSSERDPAWTPDGSKIAFFSDRSPQGVYLMNPDGSAQAFVVAGFLPDWHPSGDRIVFTRFEPGSFQTCGELPGAENIWTAKPDGTDAVRLTNHQCGIEISEPAWSPDGSKLLVTESCSDLSVTECQWAEIWRYSTSGAREQNLTNAIYDNDRNPDWQPIPINAYARPKGATPTSVALVPAYAQCTAPNRTHGPPLSFGSCNPPAQTSSALTVGTPDANGRSPGMYGFVRYDVQVGTPGGIDEADVKISLDLHGIYEQGTLGAYSGQLQVKVPLRITDKLNTPHPGGPGAATVSDTTLSAAATCTPTGDPTQGSDCNLTTTADSLVPGTVTEGKRAIWQLGQVRVDDANGDPFLKQGLFVP